MTRRRSIWLRILLHAVLMGGAVAFSLPFVWMISTSVMSDKELFREGLHFLPRRVVPHLRSPYVDSSEFPPPQRPSAVSKLVWREWKPKFLSVVRHRIEQIGLPPDLQAPGDVDLTYEVLKGVWQTLIRTTDPLVWSTNMENALRTMMRNVTPEMVRDAADRIQRKLCLGYITVRTKDFRHIVLANDSHPADFWQPATPNVRLQRRGRSSSRYVLVHYDLSNSDRWTVTATVPCPVGWEAIKSLNIAMRQDETWHRFTVAVEFAGKRWEADERLYLGGYQWQELILKPYDPQGYDPYSPHLWTWLKSVGEGPQYDHGSYMKIELTVYRTSTLEAWYGKASHNYRLVAKYVPFWRYIATSVALVSLNIVLMLVSSSLAAYAFARLNWPGRDLCFVLLLGTLMIPSQVTLIPGFIIMKWLGWYNTLTPLWIGAAFGNAFNIFLLRQFMKSIPQDLEDAARIDGCGFFRIWWHIMLPLTKPTLAAIAVFTFMASWNDFMTPLIYLNDHRLYPLALGLFALQTVAGTNHAVMMAASVLMTAPIIAVFFFAQKYFIQGITLTGMKA